MKQDEIKRLEELVTPRKLRKSLVEEFSHFRHFCEAVLPPGDLFTADPNALTGIATLDALSICSAEINLDFLRRNEVKKLRAKHRERDYAYFHVQKYSFRGSEFLHYSKPKDPKKTKPYQIQINPTQFSSYKKLRRFLKEIIPNLRDTHLTRVDVSILLPIRYFSVELIFHCLWAKGKSIQEWYGSIRSLFKGGFRETVNYGRRDQGTDRFAAYNRSIKYNKLVKNRGKYINIEILLGPGELRDVSVNSFMDLPKLLEVNPFGKYLFFNLYEANANLNEKQNLIARDFQLLALVFGFHNARSMMYKRTHNNVRADLLFSELTVSSQNIPFHRILSESLRIGMGAFFKGRSMSMQPIFHSYKT